MLDENELKRRIKNTKDAIDRQEEYLVYKKENADKNPDSLFYKGALKNAIEHLEELKLVLLEYEDKLKLFK